jgi:release factor glutamine methyltransferase
MTYTTLYHEVIQLVLSKFEAGQLFFHATNRRPQNLVLFGGKEVPEKEAELLLRLCKRRRAGEPLQYLLGEWEFYSLPFKVGRGVLIPRADTETLVDAALDKIKSTPNPEVLDLCSGTGCIAIALAHERPDARVTALEVSDAAYAYLLENISLNHSPVTPKLDDLMYYRHPRALDLVTANPPYIPADAIATLQREVLHEPRGALDGGKDGLDFYRAIARLYKPQLKPGGWICLEVGIGQAGQVSRLLAEQGFNDIGTRNDYGGIARVVYATLERQP